MTDEQRASWQAYVDQLTSLMRVSDWRIIVDDVAADAETDAQMWFAQNQPTARLRLSVNWQTFTADKHRHCIVHELVHIHLHWPWEAINEITAQLGPQAEAIADRLVTQRMEFATDQLALVIAPFLPLPPSPAAEGAE